jgi:hypothetical protein
VLFNRANFHVASLVPNDRDMGSNCVGKRPRMMTSIEIFAVISHKLLVSMVAGCTALLAV